MKQQMITQIETIKEDLFTLSKAIYSLEPQSESNKSILQMAQLLLEKYGFKIVKNQFNTHLVLEGRAKGGNGPTVAYFFDHSSPENLLDRWNTSVSTPMSIGAAIGLGSVLKEIGGKITIFGTPWEEKEVLIEQKLLKDVDMAIILQAGRESCESGSSLSIRRIKLDFKSKSTPSSAFYEEGSNPLHGVIQIFNGIYALRESLPTSIQISGIITNGGSSPDRIPREASAEFYISSPQEESLQKVLEKVKNCAEGAALQTGTDVSIGFNGDSYDHFITNESLNRLFCHNLKEVGIINIHGPEKNHISLKAGSISHKLPTIYPCVGLQNISPEEDMKKRSEEALTPDVEETILKGSQAAAFTAWDILSNKSLWKEIQKEFKDSLH